MAETDKPGATEFERGVNAEQQGIVSEFMGFLGQNKKWWLGPILGVLLLLGVLVILSGTAVAPFIYTLF